MATNNFSDLDSIYIISSSLSEHKQGEIDRNVVLANEYAREADLEKVRSRPYLLK